jgi:hypothetical protein
VPQALSDRQKVKRVEALIQLKQIFNDLETDYGDEIATFDEPWFQHLYESSDMFMKSLRDIIPMARKEISVKETMFIIFFTNRKLLIAEYLSNGQKCSQDFFISNILPELEREK